MDAMTPRQKQGIMALAVDSNGNFYYNEKLDGKWGPKSKEAADRFMRDFAGEDVATEPAKKPGDFWEEIEYFDRNEFACKCGGKYCDGFPVEPKEAMVRLANDARKHFGKKGIVISGLRCRQHNADQPGAAVNSQHMYGEACDLQIRGISADELLAYIQKQPGVRYAYKINDTNVHFDIPKGAR